MGHTALVIVVADIPRLCAGCEAAFARIAARLSASRWNRFQKKPWYALLSGVTISVFGHSDGQPDGSALTL